MGCKLQPISHQSTTSRSHQINSTTDYVATAHQSLNQSINQQPPLPLPHHLILPNTRFPILPLTRSNTSPPPFFFPLSLQLLYSSAATIYLRLILPYLSSILPNRNERRDPARHAQRDKPIATCTSWAQHNMRR